MLSKCPECNMPVSDKAIECPHCGYPLKNFSVKRARRKPNKRKRLPNGFGQISELKRSGLRKPFRAMVTVGKTDEGKPICKLLKPEAYFETYNDAYQALMKYNRDPYDISKDITLEELYERWQQRYQKETLPVSFRYIKGTWNYCQSLKNIKVREIRARHIKQCLEESTAMVYGVEKSTTPVVRRNIKTLFNKMLDYAVEYGIIEHNYAKDVILSKNDSKQMEEERTSHIPFTDDEMKLLWENINDPTAEIVIFQCYTGWRPGEMEKLETENINLEEGIMVGGLKTDCGRNRIVPIHSRIKSIVEKWYADAVANNRKYLMTVPNKNGTKFKSFTYQRYAININNLIQSLHLDPNHRAHDGRVHFVTMAKKYNMDEYAIKRIVGHNIKDLTESVYTKRDNAWLKNEMEKIK